MKFAQKKSCEKRRLLRKLQREAKEKELPIPRNLKEAGLRKLQLSAPLLLPGSEQRDPEPSKESQAVQMEATPQQSNATTSESEKAVEIQAKPKKKKNRAPYYRPTTSKRDNSIICPFTGKFLMEPEEYAKVKEQPRKGKWHHSAPDHCRKCGETFADDNLIPSHIRQHHFDSSKAHNHADNKEWDEMQMQPRQAAFRCEEQGCDQEYAYIEQLASHAGEVHQRKLYNEGLEVPSQLPAAEVAKEENFRKVVCPHCHVVIRKLFLKTHTARLHEEGTVLCYPCDFPNCTALYKFQYQLSWHRRSVHLKSSSFPCKYCDKTFGTPLRVRAHMLIHEGRRHNCRVCGKSFGSNQGKIHHEVTQHSRNGPEFACESCGKKVC